MQVLFAVDSIPAVFGVTTDPFIALSSNAFALLGLRALYVRVRVRLRCTTSESSYRSLRCM